MRKWMKLFAVTALLFNQATFASSLLQQTENQNFNHSQDQQDFFKTSNLNDQDPPDMSDEEAYIKKSQNRIDELNKEKKNMINEDQKMRSEGYDPNEKEAVYSDPHL